MYTRAQALYDLSLSRVLRPSKERKELYLKAHIRLIELASSGVDSNIEFADSNRKTKPRCVKGTACGWACISGKLTCRQEVAEDTATKLVSMATGSQPVKQAVKAVKLETDLSRTGWKPMSDFDFEATESSIAAVKKQTSEWQTRYNLDSEPLGAPDELTHDAVHVLMHTFLGLDSDGIRKSVGLSGEVVGTFDFLSAKSGPSMAEEAVVQVVGYALDEKMAGRSLERKSLYDLKPEFIQSIYEQLPESEQVKTEAFIRSSLTSLENSGKLSKMLSLLQKLGEQ